MDFDWKITTFLLCCYGFFKEIRPSEPFLTEYLISNHTGVTEDQVRFNALKCKLELYVRCTMMSTQYGPIHTLSCCSLFSFSLTLQDTSQLLFLKVCILSAICQFHQKILRHFLHCDMGFTPLGLWSQGNAVYASNIWSGHSYRGGLLCLHLCQCLW